MKIKTFPYIFHALLCLSISTAYAEKINLHLDTKRNAQAQITQPAPQKNEGNWYFSWGYNKDYWSNSNIHVSQPGLNSDFTVYNVAAGDSPGWTSGIFNKDLMSPQYNIRIGRFINRAHTLAIELNFDHTKYNSNLYQWAHVKGKINGVPINQQKQLTPSFFNYMMHNGANQLMVNIVGRKFFFIIPKTNMRLYGTGKFGLGILLPHPINTIDGNSVDVGPKKWGNYFGWRDGWWQFGGWTSGIELGFQLYLYKMIYFEFTNKIAYNAFSDIQVYKGRADQSVWLNELIMNLGFNF